MFKNVFFFLFTHFSVGLIFTILLISLNEIGKLFFRLTTWLACILILIAVASKPFGNIDLSYLDTVDQKDPVFLQQLSYFFFIFSALFMIIYNLIHPRFHKQLLSIAFIAGILGISCYSLAVYKPLKKNFVEIALIVTNGVAATLILGSALGAMITGHWYLVKHKLSLSPLKSSSLVYIFSVFLRILLVASTMLLYWKVDLQTRPVELITDLNFDSYIFFCRVGFGLILPAIFGFMIWSSVKIRSTQSATGILYATIVLVLIGETFAKFLYFSVGIPM